MLRSYIGAAAGIVVAGLAVAHLRTAVAPESGHAAARSVALHYEADGPGGARHMAVRPAIWRPNQCKKPAILSGSLRGGGWHSEILAVYERYSRIATRPVDWPALFTRLGALFRNEHAWQADAARDQGNSVECVW